jgi:hypothetical protein
MFLILICLSADAYCISAMEKWNKSTWVSSIKSSWGGSSSNNDSMVQHQETLARLLEKYSERIDQLEDS